MSKETIMTSRTDGKPATVMTHKQYNDGSSKSVTKEQGSVGYAGKTVLTSKFDGK
jgi:hypothetical protein